MLPRELDGVVDPSLIVYGTSNLRVVDVSVMPFVRSPRSRDARLANLATQQLATHLMATAYVIGEKAADIIKTAYRVHIDEADVVPQVPLDALDAIHSVREQATEAIAGARQRASASQQIPLGEFSRSTSEL